MVWQEGLDLQRDYPMRFASSLGVGGPADYFLRPRSLPDVQEGLRFAEATSLPVTLVGYGTNLLVTDKGIRGLVIQLADSFAAARVEGNEITATAGCLFGSLSRLALRHSLTGLEFAIGVPGGLGGALYMNAGAYDGEIGPLVKRIAWLSSDGVGIWTREEFSYSYRMSRIQKENVIVTEAVLSLQSGCSEAIGAQMLELQAQRRARQPLEHASAGSTFKRPPGRFVGPMIEEAGLKGFTIGGAQVSTKHAGFLINTGTTKAQDFLDLIAYIQHVIQDRYGVLLEPEIRILGER